MFHQVFRCPEGWGHLSPEGGDIMVWSPEGGDSEKNEGLTLGKNISVKWTPWGTKIRVKALPSPEGGVFNEKFEAHIRLFHYFIISLFDFRIWTMNFLDLD